ncbi:DUF4190 domain-containing protein [Demequina activiva]|uniref:DUF4190 domain-containing protein n=1 Tax=Demequina activiva TaxID=1582364 RepID=A0A919UK59_9MICO|nr:DUF4190 domain-containing protein [Demequina activiva]GIG53383.1 hypothetical protein Dac01nite_01350 [Demequina activiva]
MTTPPEDPFARTPHQDAHEWSSPSGEAGPQHDTPPPPPPGQVPYAMQQYPPPPYQQGYYGPDPRTQKNWMGIVSLVASLSTIVTGIGCIAGIVFGHLGLNAAKNGEANNRGLSLAGLITGYVFLGIGLLVVAAYVVFFAVLVSAETTY